MLGDILHDPETREEWLSYRAEGIGASEAGAVLGINPYCTARQLWERKTHRAPRPDLSANAAVNFGIAAEEHIRALWALMHPGWTVEHHALRMYGRGHMYATLDGEITDPEGRRGILEIKTATPHIWREWDGRIPDAYYAQLLHQLAVCPAAEFAILVGFLRGTNGASWREYTVVRAACEEEIQYLIDQEERFWREHIEADVPPPDILPTI